MAQQIQFRRGSSAQWTLANPILAEGEIGFEIDTSLYKIGNGSDAYNDLNYNGLNPELGIASFEVQDLEPSAAPLGMMRFYSKSIGGRILPKIVGPSGLDTALQPAIFGNGIQVYLPGTTTAMNVIGGPALTAVGTVSHPVLASTNLRTQTSRTTVASAATTPSAAELRVSSARIWRGDSPGLGGFFHRTRFSIESNVVGQRSFFGYTSSTSAIPTSQEPNALINCIGVGNGTSDTNLKIYSNDGAGLATEVDLGSGFPSNNPTTVYDLTLFHAPNASTCSWEVVNLSTGARAVGVIANADLPVSTQFLAYHAYMNNGTTAASVIFNIMRIYTETDY